MKTHVCTAQDVSGLFHDVDGQLAAGLRPTLAVVFASVALNLHDIGRGFARRQIDVVGVTTAGEIANARMLEEGCVALLLEADRSAFFVSLQTVGVGQTVEPLARALGRRAVERFANPIVIAFVSGVRTDGEPVVPGVHAGAGRPIPLFGGMAGDDLTMKNTYVFSGDATTEEGLAGLVLDGDRYEVEGIAANGWQPVGVEKTITSSSGNIVYTIDGEPALDLYRKYLDIPDHDGISAQPTGHAIVLGVQYPLSVRRENGTSVIRAPLFYGPDKSLIFAGGVPQGAKVKFCIPPSIDIVERVVAEAAGVRESIPDADALILVSCKARHMALGPLAEDEISELYKIWGAPMAGYFSYGEIGAREPHHCDFHTETCTLVVLKEAAA
jgi:hypothetical protein